MEYSQLPLSRLENLPVEVLHRIFKLLAGQDVCSARASCSTLMHVGDEYFLQTVRLLFTRDRFERLREIARHSVIAKHVKSLYFQGDRFAESCSFEEWDKMRLVESLEGDPKIRALHNKWRKEVLNLERASEYEKFVAYESYQKSCLDQEQIITERLDLNCLAALFKACPQLDDVTISFFESNPGRRWWKDKTLAFRATHVRPSKPWLAHPDNGLHQLATVIEAAKSSGRKLRKLTLTGFTHDFLLFPNDNPAIVEEMLKDLHELRVDIRMHGESLESEVFSAVQTAYARRMGKFHSRLSVAKNLRVLKIRVDKREEYGSGVELSYLVYVNVFPKLRDVAFNGVTSSQWKLASWLRQHRKTLRRLSLCNVHLRTDYWFDLFKQLGGTLPKLGKIRLTGVLTCGLEEHMGFENFSFAAPDEPHKNKDDSFYRALERYVFHRGSSREIHDMFYGGFGMDEEENSEEDDPNWPQYLARGRAEAYAERLKECKGSRIAEWQAKDYADSVAREYAMKYRPHRGRGSNKRWFEREREGYTSDGSVISWSSDRFDAIADAEDYRRHRV